MLIVQKMLMESGHVNKYIILLYIYLEDGLYNLHIPFFKQIYNGNVKEMMV